MAQNPKPQSVAIVAADAEFGRNACDGARENAKNLKLRITYDRTYPPPTTDFAPIVRAIQASNPDLVMICSYPLDSVGMLKAINEIGFKPKMIGGAMVGLQATAFKMQLGPLLNGIVNYETWLPFEKLQFPGSMELLKKYQARAAAEGVDPLGYYMPVWAYAYLQVLGDSITATKSLERRPDRRPPAQDHVQDHGRRREVRRQGRMGQGPDAADPVPEHQGRLDRPVPRPEGRGAALPAAVQVGRHHLPVREGEAVVA